MRKTIYILTLVILTSCNLYDRKEEVFMTDQDYVENDRQVSPDGLKLLINYSLDLGAFGYGQAGTAILKLSDTTKNLREFTIPNTLTRVKWIDNENISAQFDILPSLRTGDKVELKDSEVNELKSRFLLWTTLTKMTDKKLNIEKYHQTDNLNLLHIAT